MSLNEDRSHPSLTRPPSGQVNAHISSEQVMRVGIPHKSGHLPWHAFQSGYPALVSAAAFWDRRTQSFKIPEATDLSEVDFALDSAGFTAVRLWQSHGTQPGMAGVYPWSIHQYLELANSLPCAWYAQPDLCCEPSVSGSPETVDYRINATATLLEGCLRVCYAWQNELARDPTISNETIASLVRPPTAVLQGWTASDYEKSYELLSAVWSRWQPWLAAPALIGVGSVCRRSVDHPDHGLLAILSSLERFIPNQTRLHLFGIKGTSLDRVKMIKAVASFDSMAFDYSARMKALHNKHSNSMRHRSREMTDWMTAAAARLKPSPGDQFRLPLFG